MKPNIIVQKAKLNKKSLLNLNLLPSFKNKDTPSIAANNIKKEY